MGRTLSSGGPSVKTADPWGGHCQNAGRPICPAPMDLIGTLSSQLGIPADQAQAVAGGVLGALQSKVKGELGDQVAGQLGQAVPELSGWQAKAGQLLGGGGGADAMSALGGLLGGGGGGAGGLAGALGGAVSAMTGSGEAAALAGLIGKLGLDPAKAAMVAPMALEFLKSRLNPELLGTVLKVAPFLTGGGGASSGGGDLASQASSLLGGLLK
ncbi:MAG: DUF2780 domain-containing protein [Deltaproteobacteria bacterium]|nr:DUF2780 domain-containing protein [Deltaproteobacteria bacterium]